MQTKTFRRFAAVAASGTGALFLLAIVQQWPRSLFYCEGWSCSAAGVAYLLHAALIVVAFSVLGALLGPRPRWSASLSSGGAATLAMFLVFIALFVRNEIAIPRAMEAHEKACAEHPVLCPENAD